MTTKVEPTYATLMMGILDNTLFERISGVFDELVHLQELPDREKRNTSIPFT